jgi:MYXO-CTERM domain-containing protein
LLFADCETEKVEECTTECEQTGAALFCDGQYITYEDLDACAGEIEAEFEISVDLDVDVDIDGGINIGGDDDDGMGGASDNDDDDDVEEEVKETLDKAGCSVALVPALGGGGGGFIALLGLGMAALRRRRGR